MAKKFTKYVNEVFIKSVIGDDLLDKVVEYIKDNLHPEDVFDEDELNSWAEDNGFVKPE